MIKLAKKKFYVTTTIPYANAEPHVGFALEIIQADVLARFHKQLGEDVFFLTGTDEYGVKNYQEAKKLRLTTKQFVDKNSATFKKLTKTLNISNDYFIRTTDKKVHWPGVIKMWNSLKEKGDIYKKKYTGSYCSGCERFVTEKDLVDGKCPNHPNREIEHIAEENYFFRLSKYSNKIKKLIETDKLKIHPNKRKNDFLALIKDGLQDVSFSRDKKHLPWGLPVPGDPSQIMYVWCDALTNYLTGIGFPNKKYKKYWPADVHVVGKDMLRFHAGIWPGMLLSAGLPLPKVLAVHGFLTVNGQKISKSLDNVISPVYLAKKYGVDSVRYFLLRDIPSGDDGDFSEQALVQRHNSELANSLGNLLSRSLTLIEKAGGKTPKGKIDSSLKKKFELALKKSSEKMDKLEFHHALEDIWSFISAVNVYVDKNKPWTLKGNKLNTVLYNLAESLRVISALIWPFIPDTAEEIAKQLGIKVPTVEKLKYGQIKLRRIKKGKILFKKFETSNTQPKKEKGGKQMVSFNEWQKLDLRVGEIKEIEDIKGSDKLYKITINLGSEIKTTAAGFKPYYSKEEIKGRKIIFLANLEPVTLRGVKSEGMILAAVKGNKVAFLEPEKDIAVGAKIE